MKKYSANYVLASSNFVIQNLRMMHEDEQWMPCINVVRNILQRGCPTMMSRYLQEQVKGMYNLSEDKDFTVWIGKNPKGWQDTIKGADSGYNPAKMFYEEIVPRAFGEAVQAMIIPEYEINDIVGKEHKDFINQQVDFYLPQARLVIEIDGGQHDLEENKILDNARVKELRKVGVMTIRITTDELRNGTYGEKIRQIRQRLEEPINRDRVMKFCNSYEHLSDWGALSEFELMKLRLTAVMRFELLVLDLLEYGYLKLGSVWNFNIVCDEPLGDFAEWALADLYRWMNNYFMLWLKKPLRNEFRHTIIYNGAYEPNKVNVDFSVLKRYTDENKYEENIVFVRGDYFEYSNAIKVDLCERNYFRVSTSGPINYHITEADKPVLEFFLRNVFGLDNFRPGQFAIIANALNMEDTVGLLPTGGGKSLCYQLPCLLQPCINFVVCPIKALMEDQVKNLGTKACRIDHVNFINSDIEGEDRREVIKNFGDGKYLFVVIAPERFQTSAFRGEIKRIVNQYSIAYAVIDEVHCMSEWGHQFRPSYLNLTETIDNICPKDEYGEGTIKFIGLTATASLSVLKDIKVEFARGKQSLADENVKSLLDYSRKELEFEVIKDGGDKLGRLLEVFEENNIPNERGKATLVFTPNVNGKKGCFDLANELHGWYPRYVGWYSGDVPKNFPAGFDFKEHKQNTQDDFKKDFLRILCATKAFGMGIDKDNIYYTVHYGLPASIEALYQEAGRAGRWDKNKRENRGKKAKCYVLYSGMSEEDKQRLESIFNVETSIEDKKLGSGMLRKNSDISSQMFLLMNSQFPIQYEFDMIKEFVKPCIPNQKSVVERKITVHKIKHISEEIYYGEADIADRCCDEDFDRYCDAVEINREMYAYRLKLMGIVKDWEVDFNENTMTIFWGKKSDDTILKSIEKFVKKYNPDEDVRGNIKSQPYDKVFDQGLMYLLKWIQKNMFQNRLQSLKNVMELCEEYTTGEEFKQRLESYFVFTETTFVLQYISENPRDYKKWFEVFYDKSGAMVSEGEIKKTRDRLSRFLESFHNNVGLNFVSGMVRLGLRNFDNSDGRDRLVNALKYIDEEMPECRDEILRRMIVLIGAMNVSRSDKEWVCDMILQYSKEMKVLIAGEFNMPYMATEIVEEKIKKLRNINNTLYEQFRKI